MSDDDAQAISDLMVKGPLNTLVFQVDDVDALVENAREATARSGTPWAT